MQRTVKNADIQELKESLVVAIEFFEINEKSMRKSDEIAQALCLLALEDINNGYAISDLYYDYQMIYKAVWGQSVSSEKASQMVRNHLEKAISSFDRYSPLDLVLKEKNCSSLFILAEASKGKHRSHISLGLRGQNGHSNHFLKSPTNQVLYSAVQLPKPNILGKPFMDMHLKPSVLISVGSFLVVLASIAFLTMASLINWDNNIVFTTISILFFPAAYILYKLYDLMEVGVTDMPMFMSTGLQRNALLVLHKGNRSF